MNHMNIRSKLTTALAALTLAAGGIFAGLQMAPTDVGNGDKVITSGVCIRFGEDGPYFHTNTAHYAVGLIDTSVPPFINDDGLLEIKLRDNGQPNSHPVVSMTVASDETLTAAGIFGGASSGTTEVRIKFAKTGVNGSNWTPMNLQNETHYDRISGPLSNVWITLVHAVEEN